MKIGQIKLQTLVLMNLCNETKFELENFSEYMSENKYNRFLINMDEPIKRAIDIINSRNVLHEKSVLLRSLKYTLNSGNICVNLNQIKNLNKVKNVVLISDSVYNLKYSVISNKIYIYSKMVGDIFIVYYPKITLADTQNDTEINLPENLARIIPYFVKYELYQEEEPNIALLARNDFDTLLEEYSHRELYDQDSNIERIFEV